MISRRFNVAACVGVLTLAVSARGDDRATPAQLTLPSGTRVCACPEYSESDEVCFCDGRRDVRLIIHSLDNYVLLADDTYESAPDLSKRRNLRLCACPSIQTDGVCMCSGSRRYWLTGVDTGAKGEFTPRPPRSTRTDYDAAHRPTSVASYDGLQLDEVTVYQRDSAGHLLRKEVRKASGQLRRRDSAKYVDGRLVQEETDRDGDGKADVVKAFRYDAEGRRLGFDLWGRDPPTRCTYATACRPDPDGSCGGLEDELERAGEAVCVALPSSVVRPSPI